MTDSEKLDYLMENVGLIAQETVGLKREAVEMKNAAGLKQQMTPQEERMASLEQEVEALKRQMMLSEERMNSLEQEITALKCDAADIRMYQEKVLMPCLKRVTEGHVNLTRKLNDERSRAIEWEVHYLRVNVLEWEIRCIKEKLTPV